VEVLAPVRRGKEYDLEKTDLGKEDRIHDLRSRDGKAANDRRQEGKDHGKASLVLPVRVGATCPSQQGEGEKVKKKEQVKKT